jgi:hypothetical protein
MNKCAKLWAVQIVFIFTAVSHCPIANAQLLDQIESDFHKAYADDRSAVIASLGPYILVKDDKITLVNGKTRIERSTQIQFYDQLKVIDHIPLSMFLILREKTGNPLDADTIKEMESFRDYADSVVKILPQMNLPPLTLKRQERILADSAAFANRVIKAKTTSAAELDSFSRGLGNDALENAYEAIAAQLTEMEKDLNDFTAMISPEDRKRLHVVVYGSHMPRLKNATMQLLEKYFGEEEEGNHIIYCEGIDSEEKGLELLATHIVDSHIGLSFFGDRWRMHRDLLGDGAARFLKEHKIPSHPLSQE